MTQCNGRRSRFSLHGHGDLWPNSATMYIYIATCAMMPVSDNGWKSTTSPSVENLRKRQRPSQVRRFSSEV
jgi:hypothetical protein